MFHLGRRSLASCAAILVLVLALSILNSHGGAKDHKKEHPQKGNLCIARFESTTGEPLYYTCPRPNESEKKSYCCQLDKCCDYKEFQKQAEQQYKSTQFNEKQFRTVSAHAIGGVLKALLWIVFIIILLIVGCCCLVFLMCRKKKLFQGGVFSSPLPAQPPGPSPYAPPSNPYMAYQWPPETANSGPPNAPAAPPAYPSAAYPPYPSSNVGPSQPPFNPNFK